MTDTTPESSSNPNGKRKLYVACKACRFRKVKCDREFRLEQGFSACTNCENVSMECILNVSPPKKRMGKRMKLLREQNEQKHDAFDPASIESSSSSSSSSGPKRATDIPNFTGDASRVPYPHTAPFTNSLGSSLGMSPGFSSLLQAVSQEQTASSRETSSSFATTYDAAAGPSNGIGMAPYVEAVQPHSSIIQNGMFATLGSNFADAFPFSNGNTSATNQRRTSHQIAGATAHSIESESPQTSGITPKSNAAASDQSSPDVIASNAAFLSSVVTEGSSARAHALRRRNPFDKPSPSDGASQVGFVGGLLGIASLDKHMLDVCVKSYFESLGQCIGFIRPEWFWPRYNAFFSRYSGFFVDVATNPDDRPLSELLLIAVACRGAGASQFANRFELQKDLAQHYSRLIKDRERLVRDGFDALESVILMVEHADGTPKPLSDAMSIQGVFDIEVLSHEGLIRLMKKLELQLEKPFGVRLEGRDLIRQRVLFWTIYVYDAIRSEAGRTVPLILDDDISLVRSFPANVGDPMRIAFRDYFVDLAKICRKVSYKIQSPRAQGFGIEPGHVIEVLDDLKAWHDRLSPLFAWDWNDMLHITGPSDPEDQTRRTFLMFLFLGQWITLDYAVEEIKYSDTCDPVLKEEANRRLEREVDATLDRQVLICDHGTLFGLIRLHPGMMQSWTITWAMWCIKRMHAIIAIEGEGRLASAKADQEFQRYQSSVLCFINATASCDTVQHTATTVQDLMNALRRVTDARKSVRLRFDSV